VTGLSEDQIFQPTDSSTQRDALGALGSLIITIYADADFESTSDVQGVAKDICAECAETLREPERSQAAHAVKVVSCLLRGAGDCVKLHEI
jgi:DNA repair/transcription protein MET18/MMS19